MMATFTDPVAFANHVAAYGAKIQAAERPAVAAATRVAAAAIKAEASGYHIGRQRLGVDVSSNTVTATPRGAWKIVEKGAKAHRIGPRRGRRAVVVPGRGVFAHVQHPAIGPIGHPWEKGVAEAKRTAPFAARAEFGKVFG